MRILVDITHPAHVHFFRHAIAEWKARGHSVLVTARSKDLSYRLLDRLGLDYEDLGTARTGLLGLGIELPVRTARLLQRIRRFEPDVLTAVGGVYVAQAGWLSRKPSVVFYDTENAHLSNLLTYPSCTCVSTPACYEGWVPKKKHVTYDGYHELAYTHPKRFTPDGRILERCGLSPETPFVVVRLVSWASSHDVGQHGVDDPEHLVAKLSAHAKVFVSSERELPASLEEHRLRTDPEHVHHLLAFARLFIGESATMASEAATLGTPAILISTTDRGYTNHQEARYGLTTTFTDRTTRAEEGLSKALEILSDPESSNRWREKRRRMLSEMIDVTEHIVHLVESTGRPGSDTAIHPNGGRPHGRGRAGS